MVSNKKRLYLALYPNGIDCGREKLKYHLALLVGPKHEKKNESGQIPGKRFHIKHTPAGTWALAEDALADVQCTTRLLARVLVAKITDEERLFWICRNEAVPQGNRNFNCRVWVINVLARVWRDEGRPIGTAAPRWDKLEPKAMGFVEAKIKAGRYDEGQDMTKPKPMWDMLRKKEIIP